MKTKLRKISTFFPLILLIALALFACKAETEYVEKTDTTAPARITNVNSTVGDSRILLTWINPEDSDFYATRISFTPKIENITNPIVVEGNAGESSSVLIEGLKNSTEYNFSLIALDKSLNESEVVSITATPVSSSDTTAPQNVTNLSSTNLDKAVELTWTDPTDSDLFGIQITYTKNSSSRAVVAMEKESIFVSPGTQSAIISKLTNGTSYTFTLKAMDTSGNFSAGVQTTITPTEIEGNLMTIALSPSTTKATNQDVVVQVNITTDASSLKSVKYENGEKTVSYFASNGTEISADSDGKYSFSVSENGTYTVYALDIDGRRETQTITISNIDKIAPNAVLNLSAIYSYTNKTITVTWATTDTDIDYYLLSYSSDGETQISDTQVKEKTYTLTDIQADEKEYTFTVKAVDTVGNTSTESTATVIANILPSISSVTLDRYHIAYNDSDLTVNVTVKGSNFDKISGQDDTNVKIQLVYIYSLSGSINESINSVYEATVDTENNTATATITAPSLGSAYALENGTNYTVRVYLCGTIDSEHTATLNISKAAEISSVSLSTTQISVEEATNQTTTATVTGTNLDVAGAITLQFYDSTGTAYGNAVTVDTSNFEMHETDFTTDIAIPTTDGTYTLKVLFDGTAQSQEATLQVYDVPKFDSLVIPNAGISAAGKTVTATVKGKNFTAPNISSENFTVTCSTTSIVQDSVITVSCDTRLKVTLNIPSTQGEYEIKVVSGNNSVTGTFTVKDYSSYSVGQIILADCSLVDSSSYTAIDNNNPPVAIVGGFNDNGAALGVGLHIHYYTLNYSYSSLKWTPWNYETYGQEFTNLICTPSTTEKNTLDSVTFTGDTDGSDNWDVICSLDPTGAADAASNYPAFNWVDSYSSTYAEELGTVTEGWYMPSIAELCYVFRNIETISATFDIINNKEGNNYTYDFNTVHYWSSSQVKRDYTIFPYTYASEAYCLNYSSKLVENDSKDAAFDVLAVRAF